MGRAHCCHSLRPLWQHVQQPVPWAEGSAAPAAASVRAYPRGEDGWVAALQHVLQLLAGGGPASCNHTTHVSQVSPPQPPTTGLCWFHGIFPTSGTEQSFQPQEHTGQFEGLPQPGTDTPEFKGIKLPVWLSSHRNTHLSLLDTPTVPVGQGAVLRDRQPPASVVSVEEGWARSHK